MIITAKLLIVCQFLVTVKVKLLCVLSCTGVWEYIESTRDVVRDLEQRVRTAKGNVEAMVGIMSKWSDSPLYQRKDDKKDVFLNLDVRA